MITRLAKVSGGINAKQRTTSNKGMLKERVFLKEEHTNCLSKTKWSVLKNIHKSNIIDREVTLMYSDLQNI